ncbi:hypothetical protein Tco_1241301 [Tanacetum coccineum]
MKHDLDEDDIPMSREEEAKFMQTFRVSTDWHDGTSSRNVSSNSNTDGLAAIVEDVKYGEFGRPTPFNGSNEAKFRVEINTRNQSASFKNLETQIEQLTKELQSRTTNRAPSSSTKQCKVVNADHETPYRPISSRKLNNLHEVFDVQMDKNKEERTTKVLQCQLPPKELNPRNFTLPCTIVLKTTNLRNTNMLVEMDDMTKKAPLGIVKNLLSRSFIDYKWVFDLEIDQLADEYELEIGKKGHILDKIWEHCKDVHRDSTCWWQDHRFEEEERDEMGIEIEKYDPPEVQVETF